MATEGKMTEVCVFAVQENFTSSITVHIMYTNGTAIGKRELRVSGEKERVGE